MDPKIKLNNLKLQKNLNSLKSKTADFSSTVNCDNSNSLYGQFKDSAIKIDKSTDSASQLDLRGVEFKGQFHKEKRPFLRFGFYQSVFALFALFIFLSGLLVYGIKNNQSQSSAKINLQNVEEKKDGVDLDSVFGGRESIASKSRLNRETTIQKDWLRRNFAARDGVLDKNFNCLQSSVCGDYADPDTDGAVNIIEYNFGTDPNNRDTDNDGISDGDELYIYFTNPRSADSDEDTVKDLDELVVCTDPTIGVKDLLFTKDALNKISSNILSKPMTEPTITSFRLNGATVGDIQTFGYFKQKCDLIKSEADNLEGNDVKKEVGSPDGAAEVDNNEVTSEASVAD